MEDLLEQMGLGTRTAVHLVEPDPLTRDTLAYVLQAFGHPVAAFPALDDLPSELSRGDALVVSVEDEADLDALRDLREQREWHGLGSEMPLVLLLGSDEALHPLRPFDREGVELLVKPVDLSALQRALERLTRRQPALA